MLPLRHALVVVIAAVTVAAAAAQAPQPRLRIVSPTQDAYLSGPVRLVAVVEPPAATAGLTGVTFFVDGVQVCAPSAAPFECDWTAGERVSAHLVRAVAAFADGHRIVATTRTRDLEVNEAVDVDVVQVTAVVTDLHGRFVTGLSQGDFTVSEDSRPQTITHFAAENIPLELVTAIDVSGSVRDALPGMKDAARRFLSGLRPADEVTLLGFNDNIFTLARRSTEPAAREKAVDRLASWGGTSLYDVIIKSVDLLGRQTGRRSIVLFTDGDDQSSHATLDSAVAQTEGSDATIYAIGQGRAVNVRSLQKLLERFATASGGRAFFTNDRVKLDDAFGEILEDLRHQYLLAYPAPDDQRDGRWHKIAVDVKGGQYKVRARQGYRLTKKK